MLIILRGEVEYTNSLELADFSKSKTNKGRGGLSCPGKMFSTFIELLITT